jgi:hypothetical protein
MFLVKFCWEGYYVEEALDMESRYQEPYYGSINKRGAIFKLKKDYEMYLTIIQESQQIFICNSTGYSIETIQYFIYGLHSGYVVYFNKSYR